MGKYDYYKVKGKIKSFKSIEETHWDIKAKKLIWTKTKISGNMECIIEKYLVTYEDNTTEDVITKTWYKKDI